MKKWIKKIGSIVLLLCLISSHAMGGLFAQEQVKEPLVFEDFEDQTNVVGTADTTVLIEETDRGKAAKMEITSNGEPSITQRSIIITKDLPIDVSDYTYVTFWVRDISTNSARVSLMDADGNSVDGIWTNNANAGKWTQLSLELSQFDNLDLTRIIGIYIGQWNSGTYFIDDIQFTDIIADDFIITSSVSSGTYQSSFDVSLSAGQNQEIYYTLDGTYPTITSTLYTGPIAIENTVTLRAVAVEKGNVSEVYDFFYTIDREARVNRHPVVVQTFEEGTEFEASTNASGEIVSTKKHSGLYSLAYSKTRSEAPERNNGSMRINFQHAVNIEGLQYLVFYIKDTHGSNTMRVSLIDGDGNESDFGWRTALTVKDAWTQYYISVDEFSGIDKSNVVAMRIGQWNAGTLYR